jgi:hypothetical protein
MFSDRCLHLLGSLCCCLILLSGLCGAQVQVRPSISGVVQDPSGAAIVGASVSLQRADGTEIDHAVTDRSGSFDFKNVAAGSYQLDVNESGFRETQVSAVVGAALHPQIRIVMRVARVSQETTVSAADNGGAVNTEIALNQSSNSIDRDALDRIPLFDQDYITTMSRFLDADSTGTNGVTLVVNGVEANGPGVTASAIQTVKINQNRTRLFTPGLVELASSSRRRVGRHSYMARGLSSTATHCLTPKTNSPRRSRQSDARTMRGPSPAHLATTRRRPFS